MDYPLATSWVSGWCQLWIPNPKGRVRFPTPVPIPVLLTPLEDEVLLAKLNPLSKEVWRCLWCNSKAASDYDYKQKYCNSTCHQDHRFSVNLEAILSGKQKGWIGKTAGLSSTLRKHLRNTRGTACSKCGWDEHHPDDGRPLTEVNHIDGDAKNCSLENLEILCPNCHAKTSNFRARNKSSSRQR